MSFVLDIFKSIGEWLLDILSELISSFIGYTLYFIEVIGAKAIGWLFDAFKVLSGVDSVTYGGQKMSITEAILGEGSLSGSIINSVYWRFAMMALAIAIAFGIAAVIRKSFDIDQEDQNSFGKILRNLFKSVLMIFLMHGIIIITMESTTILLSSVLTAFQESRKTNGTSVSVTYDGEDLQNMGIIMDTIGDYSMNPSYNSRYNLNACYNEIRPYLLQLEKKGKFRYPYTVTDDDYYWQASLQELVNLTDTSSDVPVDIFQEDMANCLMKIMELLRYDPGFKPIERYSYQLSSARIAGDLDIGRVVMVIGTLGAARPHNKVASESLFDSVREPYTYGDKDIYSFTQVERDFNVSIFQWNHLTVCLLIYFLLKTFLEVAFNVASRLFNMLFLYLIFPFTAATLPYDNGTKVKQWTTAFVIQAFSFFGTVIAMEIFMLMLPVIYDTSLVFSSSSILNMFIKSIVIIAFALTTGKAASMLSGILADSAGQQAIRADAIGGEGRAYLGGMISGAWGAATGLAGMAKGNKAAETPGDKAAGGAGADNGGGDSQNGGLQKNMSDLGGISKGTGSDNGGGNDGGNGGGKQSKDDSSVQTGNRPQLPAASEGRKRSNSMSASSINRKVK